jgi:hypothetical protein
LDGSFSSKDGEGRNDLSAIDNPGPNYQIIEGPEGDRGFPKDIVNLGDVHGDGPRDLMIIRGGPYVNETVDGLVRSGPENYLLPGANDKFIDTGDMKRYDDISRTLCVGDLNGDGYNDVISTKYPMNGHDLDWDVHSEPVTLEIRYGGGSGLSLSPNEEFILKPVSTPLQNWTKIAVKGVGDVNGDGFSDILVLSESFESYGNRYLVGEPVPQELALYYGSKDGLMSLPGWKRVIPENERFDWFDLHNIVHADINGDGHSDVVFTFYPWTDMVMGPWPYISRIAVYLGTTSGLSSNPSWVREWSWTESHVPKGIRMAHIDEDDLPDLLVFKERSANQQTSKWVLEVFKGTSSGLEDDPLTPVIPNRSWHGNQMLADVNGDGLDDIVRCGANELPTGPIPLIIGYEPHKAMRVTVDILFNVGGIRFEESNVSFRINSIFSDGLSSRTAADLDGDGLEDIVIGMKGTIGRPSLEREWQVRPGNVIIFYGSSLAGDSNPLKVLDGPRLYAGLKDYHFLVTDTSSIDPMPLTIRLTLDPDEADVTFMWRYKEDSSDIFEASNRDQAYLRSNNEDVAIDKDSRTTRVDFKVLFKWNWSHEDLCDTIVELIDENGFIRRIRQEGVFSVENDLDFVGDAKLVGEVQGPVRHGGWIAGGERGFRGSSERTERHFRYCLENG